MVSVRLKSMYFGTVSFPSNNTSLIVTHGIGQTPSYVFLQPMATTGYSFAVTSITSTSFTISILSKPSKIVPIQWLALI